MSLFESSDYRAYLRDYLKSLPKKGRGELTRIAKHLGVSATLLSQILSGARDLNLEQTHELSRYLGHTELEMDYFALLVQLERAGTNVLKNHLKRKVAATREEARKLSRRVSHERKLSDQQRAVFYSSWIYSAIHLFASTQKDGVSIEEVATRFRISKTRANDILQFLVQRGLCKEDRHRFKMGTQSTFVEQGSPYLLKHHSNWRVKAIQRSENLSESEMMFTSQVSLSKEDFNKIREKLADLLKGIAETVKHSPAEEIANLNIDWFWLEN